MVAMRFRISTHHDVSGKVLKTYFFNSKSEIDSYLFNISDFSEGVYFVKIQADGVFSISKLVVD